MAICTIFSIRDFCPAIFHRMVIVLLALAAVLAAEPTSAQVKKKPAEKVFMWGQPYKSFKSLSAACAVALKGDIAVYNSVSTSTVRCSPPNSSPSVNYTYTQTFVDAGTQISVTNPGMWACLGLHTRTSDYTGDLAACGIAQAHYTDQSTSERDLVAESHMCEPGWGLTDNNTNCVRGTYAPAPTVPSCGNPTSTGSGCKQESFPLVQLPIGSRHMRVELRYGNQFHLAGGLLLGEASWYLDPVERRLDFRFVSATPRRVISSRGLGVTEEFHQATGGSYRTFDNQVLLVSTASPTTPWKRTDHREQVVEWYDSSGRLMSLRHFGGGGFDMAYPSGTSLLPSSLSTTTGRQLVFNYTSGRLASLQLPDGQLVGLTYQGHSDAVKNISGSYLKVINFPDGQNVSFDYVPGGVTLPMQVEQDAGLPADGKPWAFVAPNSPGGASDFLTQEFYGRAFFNLSSVTDEFGLPYSSFQYDNEGRVLNSRHAGNTYQFQFDYQSENTIVTHPLGAVSTFNLYPVNERLQLGSVSRTGAGLLNGKQTIYFNYDAQGNLVKRMDVGGNTGTYNTECHKVDPVSGWPVVTVEGVTSSACPPNLDSHIPVGMQRKVSFQWHPEWKLVTKIAEPGRIKTSVYNGQPDPFNGNAVANCAPATALLPDGKPIVVLCKQVEQATTDVNGGLGFSAGLQAGVANRVTAWTYNHWGQVLTENGPRTDVNDTTTYTYYSDTTVDRMPGDLQSVTNAAGRVTQYSKYNRHGQLLESTDPNGVLTVNTYDLRQRPLSTTVGGQTTSYSYDPVGQLKRLTLPDLSYVGYDYDDAHRLVAVYDHKGNRTDYTLDNAGNRIKEETKGPSGALKRQLDRSIDALGRVQQTTGRE